jgi:hypothetical protein
MVERKGPATGGKRVEEVWEIGGEGLADFSEDYCVRVGRTVNAQRITEDAAIGVMALLIHELEGVTIREVLPIGSGGDYLIEFEKAAGPMQVEVSGIREDPAGKQAELRLAQKCAQVLQHSSCGYASVTNFHRLTDGTVHSYLHYVEEKKGRRKRQAKAKKKGRRG